MTPGRSPSRRVRGGVVASFAARALVAAAVMLAGCAAGRIGGRLAMDVTRVRLKPSFSGEGTDPSDPVGYPEGEWFEDRNELMVTCSVKLPRGFELGAGLGVADYSLGREVRLGREDGVRVWRAEAGWECGSRTVLRLGGRYEAVEDSHVLDYEESPDEQRYDSSGWTCYASVGRMFGSFGLHGGVARTETKSRFFGRYWWADDFGLRSASTVVFFRIETVEGAGGVFGSFEAGGTPGDEFDTYRLATSVGVTF